jgi:RNA polymerase-binding protein DksA
MDTPTQTHLTTLRNLLTYRLRELQADLRAADGGRRADLPAEVTDRKDEAARRLVEEVDVAEEERERIEIAAVQRALQRLDAGAYGDCATCGQPIPLQRLLAQPAAERCVACQAAFEHRAGTAQSREPT